MAFYFNYVKTIISSLGEFYPMKSLSYSLGMKIDHHYRMGLIAKQIEKEQMEDFHYQFIFHWIFLIPKFFQKIDQILPLFLSEENPLFKLEVWKSK